MPGGELPAGSRATDEKGGADMIKRYMNDDTLEAVQRLKPIADGQGLSLAQLALAWVLSNDNIAGAIIGASRPAQIADNVEAAGRTLDAGTLAAIDDVLGDLPETDPDKTRSPATRTQ